MQTINNKEFGNNLKQILQNTEMLPPLPETARELLKLRNEPDANMEQLVGLIEKDPSLAAFVVKYARMAIFSYGERITSVQHAVSLALGFNNALNMTIGVASSGCLKVTKHGPLGRIHVWRQALACAALCRELCKIMSNKHQIDSGLAYLCGLLHNFGYLLFGHLLPQQFDFLNNLCSRYPEKDIRHLELHAFGITHDVVGTYLIKAWQLPDEIATTVAEHHFPDYEGKYSQYVKLVATVNRLLQYEGMADDCQHVETTVLLESLQICGSDAEMALKKIHDCQSEFDKLADELTT